MVRNQEKVDENGSLKANIKLGKELRRFYILIWLACLPAMADTTDSILDGIERQVAERQVTPAAISEVAKIISHNERSCRAHIVMGDCCDALGLPEQAVTQYQLAFKYGPNQAKACLSLITALMKTGQTTAAGNLLKLAKQKFPIDPHILLMTGNASFRDGNYGEAEAFYRQAINEAKEPVLGLNTALATIRLRENNNKIAFELAKKDLAVDENYPPANEIAGLASMNTGQFEPASKYLKIAFENSSPSFTVAYDYTQSLIWGGKYDDALVPALCSLALAENAQNRNIILKVIDQFSMHLSKKAIEKAAKTLSHDRIAANSAIAHSQLSKICLDKGLIDLAVSESALACKLAPESSEAKFELALILEAYQHNYPIALKNLRLAHTFAPNNNEISQRLMRLEDRMAVHNIDWSWQFKNWLWTIFLANKK